MPSKKSQHQVSHSLLILTCDETELATQREGMSKLDQHDSVSPPRNQRTDEYHESEASRREYISPDWTRGRELGAGGSQFISL